MESRESFGLCEVSPPESQLSDPSAHADLAVMENEIITGMRLLGVRTLKDLKPEMVECLDNTHRIPGSRRSRS